MQNLSALYGGWLFGCRADSMSLGCREGGTLGGCAVAKDFWEIRQSFSARLEYPNRFVCAVRSLGDDKSRTMERPVPNLVVAATFYNREVSRVRSYVLKPRAA